MSEAEDYLLRWSRLHSGIAPPGLARRWLLLCFPLARALSGVPPVALTLAALAFSGGPVVAAAAGGRWVFAGAALMLIAGLLDNLDGAVAALTGRASTFGAVLDSVCDRVSDSAGFLALWMLGAPGWLAGAAAFWTAVQEYVRARAAGLGLPPLPITVWERPTRVLLIAGLLAGCGIFAGSAALIATAGATAALVFLAIAATQLAR